MMTNLFSTFDPATSMKMSMNWMSTLIFLMILPLNFWILPNRIMTIMIIMMKKMHEEFKLLLKESNGLTLMMVSLFMYILIINFMGLMPYIFTSSSHLTFSLTMALPLWLTLMLFGWINKTNLMFSHLIPSGTPTMLMPFMVLIETISNIMRPGSLAVRLTANMIAGHLMMSLLGSNLSSPFIVMIFIMQMILMIFESAVAIIQSYVFSVLLTLYSSEIN
uniref:ATP synthase F0 subunit 6 n=1 Tax=Bochrus foveatus TaxID=2969364 RepID=UPI002176DC46|nr:ATP synthase F0 subunit 6 [Bochrus foveatus]UUJ37716.1 ATP synthase F0 subunit 6 [Bochrus foveatus]